MENNNKSKGKFWIFEMYEDSRPPEWKEILEKTMLKICISPRHDRDLYISDGENHKKGDFKKPHYHVLMCFEGPTTFNNALNIASRVGANIVFQAYSAKGCYEYWTHKNNPEKAQYNAEDMLLLNGFNIEDIQDLTIKEIEEIKRDLVKIIRDNNILEYARLYDMLLDSELYEHTKVLSCNTVFFVSYLRSKRFELTQTVK